MINILNEITKIIKGNFRNKKAMIMMVLFPIVLMTILGFAFSESFSDKISLKDVKVLYTDSGRNEVSQVFHNNFIKALENNGVVFTEEKNVEEGLKNIQDFQYVAYILIRDNNHIEFYKNDRYDVEANYIEAWLNTYIERNNVITEIGKVNPFLVATVAKATNYNYLESKPLQGDRKPTSKDYYCITMLTLIGLYASFGAIFSVRGEKTQKTENRMLCSPVKRYEIMIGRILGNFLITAFQMSIVILFSIYVLGAYWGSNISIISIIIACEALMSVSIGIALAHIMKNELSAIGLMNVLIPLFAFLGGAYLSVDSIGKTFLMVADFSPLRWINQSILKVIYNNDYSKVLPTIAITLIISILFITLSTLKFRKEAKA